MPAVTVEDLLVLPRVTEPAQEGERPVVSVSTAPSGFEGDGRHPVDDPGRRHFLTRIEFLLSNAPAIHGERAGY